MPHHHITPAAISPLVWRLGSKQLTPIPSPGSRRPRQRYRFTQITTRRPWPIPLLPLAPPTSRKHKTSPPAPGSSPARPSSRARPGGRWIRATVTTVALWSRGGGMVCCCCRCCGGGGWCSWRCRTCSIWWGRRTFVFYFLDGSGGVVWYLLEWELFFLMGRTGEWLVILVFLDVISMLYWIADALPQPESAAPLYTQSENDYVCDRIACDTLGRKNWKNYWRLFSTFEWYCRLPAS